jgi:hypothetical protein
MSDGNVRFPQILSPRTGPYHKASALKIRIGGYKKLPLFLTYELKSASPGIVIIAYDFSL